MLNCRIYPNGEFSIWEEKRAVKPSLPPDKPDYLGLSLLSNSHRVALGLAEPSKDRPQRGLKGITRLGARTVRNAAFLLQQKYGVDCLSFCTFTLPWVSESAEYAVGREWAEIIRRFNQAVGRLLNAAGLPTSYVGCTEIQEKRYESKGGLPLHMHLVFPGRLRGKTWAISADQWRALWRNAVVSRVPEYESASWAAAVDCQRVKKDAAGYLGKYMSKGVGTLSRLVEDDPGLAEFLPRSWWTCSLNLRRAIGRRIAGGNDTAAKLSRDIRAGDSRVHYSREIQIEIERGVKFTVAIIGVLSPEGRKRYCCTHNNDVRICRD